VILLMILLYTVQGGVRTIVFTDTLQTAGMLMPACCVCTVFLLHKLDLSVAARPGADAGQRPGHAVGHRPLQRDLLRQADAWPAPSSAVAMTGMDQEMMQKSISVRHAAPIRRRTWWCWRFVLLAVVSVFLYLGGLLYLFAPTVGLQVAGDRIFPAVVLGYLPAAVQVLFVLALISALFPSADGALTALTSSFCIDMLGLQQRRGPGAKPAAPGCATPCIWPLRPSSWRWCWASRRWTTPA
jgi:Na+/proline symporter